MKNEAFKKVQLVTIEEGFDQQRLDNFLMRVLKGVPKSYIYRIVRKGELRVNKGRKKVNYRLQIGDIVRIPPLRMSESDSQSADLKGLPQRLLSSVIYESNELVILNKPSGVAVHGGSGVNHGAIEALRHLWPELHQLELVHRLDRDTSGCLMVSKKRSHLRQLHVLLRQGTIDKRYVALVHGRWRKSKVTVDAPLYKYTAGNGERRVKVSPEGKTAITKFTVLKKFKEATLVEAELLTGRTHQLRVHLQSLGSPILGDTKYGDEIANAEFRQLGLKRLFLHAKSLSFRLPDTKEMLRVEAPLESALSRFLEDLT